MAKSKAKGSQTPSDKTTPKAESHKRNLKKKKKILFWKKKMKGAEKKAQKDPEKAAELPPKTAEEVSANWKALQELLKRKDPPDPSSKKKPGAAPTPKQEKDVGKKGASGASVKPGPDKSRGKKARKRPALDPEGGRRSGRRRAPEVHQGPDPKGPPEPQPADIWFDDVDPDDIEAALGPEAGRAARKNLGIREEEEEEARLEKEGAFRGLTKVVALDCEMVGTGPGGEDSVAARVSLVNRFGHCVYDKFIRPKERVTDFRTKISGIRPEHLKAGEEFRVVQAEVAGILKGRILVGHAVHNDLKILFLDHPKKNTRDTQKYKPFREQVKSGRPSLKLLCEKLLNVRVQASQHSSVQDAQAAMRLYVMAKREWEKKPQKPKQEKTTL
ncbi:RNA exonuclease 4 [Anolis carolinensis]|uniref:RNA exonuclease 4 n=1 Tax=Anolis carolinensis TaxID=28377 RepID=UPI002F2B36F6